MTEPALCEKCEHYCYVHPCRGWRRRTRSLDLPFGFRLQILRRCNCQKGTTKEAK